MLDDEYYFDFLVRSGADFHLYTSRYSVDRIITKRPGFHRYLSAIEDSQIEIEPDSRVIFLGFWEPDVLLFLARNLICRPRLVLVATNNFSNGRIQRRRWILKLFLRLINPFLDRLVVHSTYEQRLVAGIDQQVAVKSVVKKHHLMIQHNVTGEGVGDRPLVSYFGPTKFDKPVEPFLQLIQADSERRFDYRLYNVNPAAVKDRLPDLASRSNVLVVESRQDNEGYMKSVKASKLLFLTHSREFEGKLSGNLCDCIALRVPYIARAMEPMISYHEHYGPLGFFVDFDDPCWARRFLDTYDDEAYGLMHRNLEHLGAEYSAEAINSNLIACFIN